MRHRPGVGIWRALKRHRIAVIDGPAGQCYGYALAVPEGTLDADSDRLVSAFNRAFNEELRVARWCWTCGKPLVADAPRLGTERHHTPATLKRQFRNVAFRCALCFKTYCIDCGDEHFSKDTCRRTAEEARWGHP